MEKDSVKEYLRESEPDKVHKGFAWSTAIALQAVDGLKSSKYLIDTAIQNVESVLSKSGIYFSVKTTVHIHRLFEKFGFDEVFGRSTVMELLGLKGSDASKVLSNLV